MKYIKQFDGLRAFAVIAVIIHHWSAKDAVGHYFYRLGAYGVDLFFVLSGFLITRILINQKSKNEPFIKSYKTFIIRRALRIFPIYYLFLGVIFIVFKSETPIVKLTTLTYQFNWYLLFSNWDASYYLGHLWSLSAEEQFYLFWPIVILLINPSKGLKSSLLFCILFLTITAGFYIVTSNMAYTFGGMKLFPFHSFVILSLGGVLAYLKVAQVSIPYRRFIFFGLILLFFILDKDSIFPNFQGKSLIRTVFPTIPLIFFLLIDKAYTGFRGVFQLILENRLLVFIGQISYGLYLYHMVIPYFVSLLQIGNEVMEMAMNILLLSIVSIVSYYLIENPINKLKRNFKY